MRTNRLLQVALLGLLVAGPAAATNGMRMTGFGPVQNSMGGVGVGTTLDGATMLSNPAGLTEQDFSLVVGGTWFKPTVSYSAVESQLPPSMTGAVVAQPGTQMNSRRGGSPIPTLAVVYPLGNGLTLGVGAFGVAGMGIDYAQNLYGGGTSTSYLQMRVTPALGYKVNDRLSVGLALNAMAAQMKWDVAAGFGQQPHDTSTALGIGVTLGAKYVAAKWLTIGAAYETKSYFQDFRFDVPAHNGVNPATFQPVPFAASTDRLSLNQPMSATIGVAIAPIDMVVVGLDVQWINWADTNGTNKPAFAANTSGAMAWDLGWSNQVVYKMGAQVRPLQSLALRAGYNYGKMPLDPNCAFENLAFPAVSEHHFSAGVGYDFSKLTLNAGAMWSPAATISGANADYPANGGQAIKSYTTSMSQVAFDFGIAYRI